MFDTASPETLLSSNAASTSKTPKYSPAILLRQRDLERDPLASIQSPHLVTCTRCNASVKLHTTSPFDTSHWKTHRSRCLKRPLGSGPPSRVIRKPVRPQETPDEPLSSTPLANLRRTTRSAPSPPLTTPTLTNDDTADSRSNSAMDVDSPSHSSSIPLPDMAKKKRAPVWKPLPISADVQEYFRLTGRDLSASTYNPSSVSEWKTWSWDQIKPPMLWQDPTRRRS